ncbi:type IV conjugative transfer system coupling protein TraD, partial [Yersinia enterocolitica]|nr:type IV conjugative transfer system coupling protein TraD [Yersinia enterocolitica]
ATLAIYWYLGRIGQEQSKDEVIGGRVLSDSPRDVARLMKKRGEASDIHIDKLPLKLNAEIQNFAMHGTVGTGKSTLMRKVLKCLRERGDLVIIYDKGSTFIEDFYDESRDKVLNAMDARCPNWDMWEECQSLPDLEAVSTTLIPSSSGEDPFWQGSARTIFAEGAERMRHDKDRSYNKFLRTLLAIQLDQLRTFLAGTPASTLVDGKIEKTAISIRSVLTNYVKALRYLQGIERPGREKFTIREWMKGQADKTKNGWLFITSNEQYHDALKPLISMWLAIAATSLLAMGENRHRRVWFFYDELPSLHKLPSLPRIIAEARKFGGCFVLGFQNYAQLEDIYGPKSAADLFDLLNTKFFFRSPSAEIARFVEKDLGEMWRLKFSEQTSFGHEQVRDGISFGKEEERVSIVSYSDVQSLNDLQCFVTFPGDYPVVKLTMKYEPMPKVADGVVLRDVQTTLDRTIEDELFKRHAEERRELNVLFTPPSSVVEMSEPVAESPSATVNSTTADTTAKQSGANDADVAVSTGSGGVEQEIGQEAVSETPPGISNEGEVMDWEAYETWQQSQHQTQTQVRRDEVNINQPVREVPGDEEIA